MKKQFTEKDLVDFGNYLLSSKRTRLFEERQEGLSIPERLGMVHDADLANFFPNIYPTNKDVIQAAIKQIEESGYEVGYVDTSYLDKYEKGGTNNGAGNSNPK